MKLAKLTERARLTLGFAAVAALIAALGATAMGGRAQTRQAFAGTLDAHHRQVIALMSASCAEEAAAAAQAGPGPKPTACTKALASLIQWQDTLRQEPRHAAETPVALATLLALALAATFLLAWRTLRSIPSPADADADADASADAEAEAATDTPRLDRRGPNRATNVVRPSFGTEPKPADVLAVAAATASGIGADEWESF